MSTFEIAKLEPKPGDVLVVRTPMVLSRAGADGVRNSVREGLGSLAGSVRVLIFDGGLDLAVLRAPMLRRVPLLESIRGGLLAVSREPGFTLSIRNPGEGWWQRLKWWRSYRRASSDAAPTPADSWAGWPVLRGVRS